MPDYKEILTQMIEVDANNIRWVLNLLDVLVDKKILNAADLVYIRDHGKKNKDEIRQQADDTHDIHN